MNLPECKWRLELPKADCVVCRSPKLMVGRRCDPAASDSIKASSCLTCPFPNHPEEADQPPKPSMTPAKKVRGGPGDELTMVLESLGVSPGGCDCKSHAAQMNGWGVKGCQERREQIIQWLKDEQAKRGWASALKVGFQAVKENWFSALDPYGSVVDEAIRRADEKERREKAKNLTPAYQEMLTQVPAYQPPTTDPVWAVGVTTSPSRKLTLLPPTLVSIKAAGFVVDRLFVDGVREAYEWEDRFGIPVTTRFPVVHTAGHWVLSLYEMFIRHPLADRYVIFQDDLLCSANLRAYLDKAWPSGKVYLNLFTFQANDRLVVGKPEGWHVASSAGTLEGAGGERIQLQTGRGAVALAFDRPGVVALLGSPKLAERPQAIAPANLGRGYHAIDGGIVNAMNQAGYSEMIHNPSLVQHTGLESTIPDWAKGGGAPPAKRWHGKEWQAETWRGEGFDCLSLIRA